MELITLCVGAIVVFGLWVEFEPVGRRLVAAVSRFRARIGARLPVHGH